MSFLKANWDNLAIFNYTIDPELLKKYLPYGTEIDCWNNKCYVSLIGFMFNNTKVLGVKIPFHTHFEEVNLRFYVKRFENGKYKRGVVFIKEIVPKAAITLVANTLYNEHYQTNKMRHSENETDSTKTYEYQWLINKNWQTIQIKAKKIPIDINFNSEAEFITEHYFGYTKFTAKKTFEYEVTHPRWQQLQVIDYKLDVDFEANYGKSFAQLQNKEPDSVFLAIGSKITVENKRTIE
jgi:uncharacterized protein